MNAEKQLNSKGFTHLCLPLQQHVWLLQCEMKKERKRAGQEEKICDESGKGFEKKVALLVFNIGCQSGPLFQFPIHLTQRGMGNTIENEN